MQINVTLKQIRTGIPKTPCHCPIALALKDQGFKNVHVLRDNIKAQRQDTPNS